MANERVWMTRNAGTAELPQWEKYFPKTIVDAIYASDADGETKKVMDLVKEEIQKVVGSAPEAFDTLQEIAAYIEEHEEVAEALQQAITNKVPNTRTINGKPLSEDITLSAGDVSAIPASQKGATDGVAELDSTGKVPTAQLPPGLPAIGGNADTVGGHTVGTDVPENAVFTDTTYAAATADTLGLVKSGGDVAVEEDGTMTVQDNSHDHTIDNIDGLQESLDGKVANTRTVNGKPLSADVTLGAADVSAIPESQKGTANGVAELDESGKVPATQLPSYVDDALEYDSLTDFPVTGESGKIYIAKDTNKTYRWSGSTYVEIAGGVALGETAATAYRGERGRTAYEHSQAPHAPVNAEANVQADWSVSDTGSDAYIKNKPVSLPANGGNADTVNGHTVEVDVPAGAKFTDTTYSKATSAMDGLMAKEDKEKLDNQPTISFGAEYPANAPANSIHFLTEG